MNAPARDARPNIDHWEERCDLAAAFRWAVRLNLHEAVANHFSLSVNEDGTKFLMNRNQMHFSRVSASNLLLLDANDPNALDAPDAPDETAWGLHGALHRKVPHARCAMHVHSIYATVLACLKDSRLPPVDQNSAMFFNRQVVDEYYGGLALAEEAERCVGLLTDPKVKTMIMGNHGVMIIGDSAADCFNRLFYFERAAETYVKALQTGRPLRVIPDDVAELTAAQIDGYDDQAKRHLAEIRAILDAEGSDYAD